MKLHHCGQPALLIGIGATLFLGWVAQAKAGDEKNLLAPHRDRVILVKKKATHEIVPIGRIHRGIGGVVLKEFSLIPGLSLIELPEDVSVKKALEYYQNQPEIEYAEPDFFYHTLLDPKKKRVLDEDERKADPSFGQQWDMHNTGQNNGKVDADINGPEMWQIQTGTKNAVLGIIDTGMDYNHPDLKDNVWSNAQEIPNNNIDEDKNGFIDDIHGANAITGTGDPMDDNMHGTHVAGTIGAVAQNGIGVTGVMPHTTMVSCKFLDRHGSGTLSDALECMQYFAQLKSRTQDPVNVIATNNSWGGGGRSQALLDAIKEHERLGILFMAAAGNSGQNNDNHENYPSNYAVSNVIAIAATDRNDNMATFSDYGKKTVHVAAPGVDILSTTPNQGYGSLSGTSMATPHVTGLAGQIYSQFPDLTYSQIKNLIITGGQILPNLTTNILSSRRIRGADVNGVGSLTCQNQVLSIRQSPSASNVTLALGSSIVLQALHLNCENAAGPLTVLANADLELTLEDNGQNGDDKASDGIYSLTWTPSKAGIYVLDFGHSDVVTINIYNNATWKNYNIVADEAFTYDNIEGTRLSAKDESIHTLTSPFPIHFAGDETGFKDLYVSSNGTISFTDNLLSSYDNKPLPSGQQNTLVAPFWDDLDFNQSSSDIYYDVVGNAPNRKLVIEWSDFKQFRATGLGTFQVVFHENSSDIRFGYLDTDLGNSLYNSGASATVGVQVSPATFSQWSHLKANVPSKRSLLLSTAGN